MFYILRFGGERVGACELLFRSEDKKAEKMLKQNEKVNTEYFA